MQKWEYKIVPLIKFAERELNRLGAEGWELVAWDFKGLYIFKRPVK